MVPVLRPYQVTAVANVERDLAVVRATMIDHATGTGKTSSASAVIKLHVARGERVLVVAHRRELLSQMADRLRLFGLSPRLGVGDRDGRWQLARVCVASIQSVARRLERLPRDAFDLIVYDEFHHACAPGALAVLAHFAKAKILGLTATTDRADGVSLGLVADRCSSRYGVAEAVQAGFLVPARCLRVDVPGLDLSTVRQRVHRAGGRERFVHAYGEVRSVQRKSIVDLHPKDLGRVALAPAAVEGITGPLLELAGAKKTIVFAVDVAHASALVVSLNARRAGCARAVFGSSHDRDDLLKGFREGEFQILVNVMVCTEGLDIPGIECVAMCRPTQSRILFSQAVGRGLRTTPEKTECLVLNFVGQGCQHTLVSPEDVLAGAMVVPVTRKALPSPPSAVVPVYVPRPWHARFATTLVNIMRRAGRAGVHFLKELIG